MIAGEHYDEEILVAMAEDRVEQDTDPHLVDCEECRISVEQYRSMISCLSDEAMWDPHPLDETPNPQTIATLRSYVDQAQREDAEAEPLTAELLAGPREEWMPRLMADGKYRTAGVVRKLIAATDRAAEESPKDYVEIAKLAVEISEGLIDQTSSLEDLVRLRAATYRERSYSQFLVGELDKALYWATTSMTVLTSTIRTSPSQESPDIARVNVLLAAILTRIGRVDEALLCADRAYVTFLACGDQRRAAHALTVRANALAQRLDYRAAIAVTHHIVQRFDHSLDDHSRANVRLNEGYYSRELGDLVTAIERFTEAAFIFSGIGARASAARVNFNLAVLLQSAGEHTSAGDRLSGVIQEFVNLGMHSTASLAALHLAETRLAERQFEEVERLCAFALEEVRNCSVAGYTERMMTALALLRTASAERRASRRLICRVRRYVEKLPLETRRTALSLEAGVS